MLVRIWAEVQFLEKDIDPVATLCTESNPASQELPEYCLQPTSVETQMILAEDTQSLSVHVCTLADP